VPPPIRAILFDADGVIQNGTGADLAISSGVVTLSGGDNRLATNDDVSVASGASFDINDLDQSIDLLRGGGTVVLGSVVASGDNVLTIGTSNDGDDDATLTGIIVGAGLIKKLGAGTLTLSGANTFNGSGVDLTIAEGVIRLSGGASDQSVDLRGGPGGDVDCHPRQRTRAVAAKRNSGTPGIAPHSAAMA